MGIYTPMPKTFLDAETFRDLFTAGARRVADSKDYLNSINVFPVPDGDTGSNMADTLTNAADALASSDCVTLEETLETLSKKLRMEAKGNSGIILAEFFHGMFLKLKEERDIHPERFIAAVNHGKEAAYAALAEPREGTMLTAIRKAAEKLRDVHPKIENMKVAIETLVDSARTAVKETTAQLSVLKESRVVDSGAHGFLLFWEGALGYLKGEIKSIVIEPVKRVFTRAKAENLTARYCVEGLVTGERFDRKAISGALSSMGESLIVTSDGNMLKVHIHTNDPKSVFEYLGQFGTLIKTKVDDMLDQSMTKAEQNRRPVMIVTDSTCDLELAIMEQNDIEMVSLQVKFGEETFRDRIDITADEFYHRLKTADKIPRTSLPQGSAFLEAFEHQAPRCDKILGIYISSSLSGTWQAGRKWGEEFEGGKAVAYDSRQATLGLGLMALEAARMAANGSDLGEIIIRLDEMREKISTFFTVDCLDYLARNGRIGMAKKVFGQALGVKPILKLEAGRVDSFTSAFGTKRVMEKLIAIIERESEKPGFEGKYAVAWSDSPEARDHVISLLKERLGAENILIGRVSPVIGSHTGPRALAVICC
jgi:hypothetical protein